MTWGRDVDVGEEGERESGTAFCRCFTAGFFLRVPLLSKDTFLNFQEILCIHLFIFFYSVMVGSMFYYKQEWPLEAEIPQKAAHRRQESQ